MAKSRVPYRSIAFMAHTARHLPKLGLRAATRRAASAVAPPLLVLDAVVSVLGAIGSFVDLAAAREHRDALRAMNPLLAETLETQRKQLERDVALAKTELEQRAEVSEALARIVNACRRAFTQAMQGCRMLSERDLPDLERVESAQHKLEEAWRELQRALAVYSSH